MTVIASKPPVVATPAGEKPMPPSIFIANVLSY